MHCPQTEIDTPKVSILVLISILWTPFLVFADDTAPYPIAGITPHQRPENAPLISQSPEKDADWYKNALHSIAEPYPASLRFLDDQGDWHTPFNRPGMTGPYDIRKWHKK